AAGVTNAGAVFVGAFAPVSLGDYCAGPNHVLPTAGCACHSSGLSVRAFRKAMHVIEYDESALAAVADHVTTLAAAEDLPGHGAAVTVRFDR
ncbi:MAG TPA: histidinol dehydrogenase, partial [Marmoricola sp.]|nr:histidinol dehydrogenase [Marmoricola sp.]